MNPTLRIVLAIALLLCAAFTALAGQVVAASALSAVGATLAIAGRRTRPHKP